MLWSWCCIYEQFTNRLAGKEIWMDTSFQQHVSAHLIPLFLVLHLDIFYFVG